MAQYESILLHHSFFLERCSSTTVILKFRIKQVKKTGSSLTEDWLWKPTPYSGWGRFSGRGYPKGVLCLVKLNVYFNYSEHKHSTELGPSTWLAQCPIRAVNHQWCCFKKRAPVMFYVVAWNKTHRALNHHIWSNFHVHIVVTWY